MRPIPFSLGAATLLALAGCQTLQTSAGHVERDPRASGIVLVRSYNDEFKIDGQDVRVHVEYAWDYNRGIAIERITAPDGALVSQSDQPELTLNLTDAEKEYAFDLARAHPEIGPQIANADHVYGGFSYREADDAACGYGSRCVHVVASAGDGWRKLVHAIVDLQTGTVVHPHFAAGDVEPYDATQLKAHKGSTP
ncbi:MAG: hypothetical protein IPK27_21235 [Rhodanobacteraceae bacterium]|nr:hypothetical protein [Rhodanobacteraceae bacterium]